MSENTQERVPDGLAPKENREQKSSLETGHGGDHNHNHNHDHDHVHKEEHFTSSETVRDVVIGMSDGLTVPFALAAGLSGALELTHTVVIAGLAEIAAGSIAMGLGGYLAAKTEQEHYESELKREEWEIVHLPKRERQEVEDVLRDWGLEGEVLEEATNKICEDEERWVDFMMKHELGLEQPEAKRARNSSLTIGLSYIVGGLIPLAPYMLISKMQEALTVSVIITLLALFIFGFIKARFMGTNIWKSGLWTTVVGGVAAGVAFFVAKMIGG
jgi:predicted membrane protein (TIGR00267 family)